MRARELEREGEDAATHFEWETPSKNEQQPLFRNWVVIGATDLARQVFVAQEERRLIEQQRLLVYTRKAVGFLENASAAARVSSTKHFSTQVTHRLYMKSP